MPPLAQFWGVKTLKLGGGILRVAPLRLRVVETLREALSFDFVPLGGWTKMDISTSKVLGFNTIFQIFQIPGWIFFSQVSSFPVVSLVSLSSFSSFLGSKSGMRVSKLPGFQKVVESDAFDLSMGSPNSPKNVLP